MQATIIQRPNFLIYLFVFLGLMGAASLIKLPISIYPAIEKPTVRVIQKFEQDSWSFYVNFGQQIESSYRAIEGVEEVESIYRRGKVIYYVHFGWDAQSLGAKRDVETITSFYQAQLPKHLPKPMVSFFDPSSENYIAFKASQLDAKELGVLIRSALIPQLESIHGVGAAWTSAQPDSQIRIQLKPYRLLQYGIEISQVIDTLLANEVDLDLGSLKSLKQGDIGTNLKQSYRSIEQIAALKIKSIPGKSVYLSDIAEIKKHVEEKERFFFLEQDEVIAVAIWPEPGANMYEISAEFQKITAAFAAQKAQLLTINNPKLFIENAILNILFAILLGMLSASVIVLLFYRKLSSIIFICTIMPLCLMIALLIMKCIGVGINLLSLGAMSIAIGMVVDNAILVMDSLMHQQKRFASSDLPGIVRGMITEVRSPIITSTLTSIVVFLPLVFTEPMIASLLKGLALVTVSILTVSVCVSLFFIPALFVLINPKPAKAKATGNKASYLELTLARVDAIPGLKYFLPLAVLTACVILIVELTPLIKKEIIAQPKAQIVDVGVKFNDTGLSRARKLEILQPLRQSLQQHVGEHLKYQYVDVRKNEAYISLHLQSYHHFEKVMEKMASFDTSHFDTEVTYDPWVTSGLNIKSEADRELRFIRQNESENRQLIVQASTIAKDSGLISRVKLTPSNRQITENNVNINFQLLADLSQGSAIQHEVERLGKFVRYSIEPHKLTDIRSDEGDRPLMLGVAEAAQTTDDYLQYPYHINGHNLLMQELLNSEEVLKPREFYSNNSRLTFSLQLWFKADVDTPAKEALIKQLQQQLGANAFTVLNPETESIAALQSIIVAIALSVIMVFLVVIYQFKTLVNTCSVMTAMIFGITGGIASIYLWQSTISLNSMLGLLILVGLSVNNTILLLDFYQSQIKAGYDIHAAIANSVKRRMRSLLVTNLTTIVGMLPLAIGFGAGQDILKPLGVCVVGGVVIATLLSLVCYPVILLAIAKRDKHEVDEGSNEIFTLTL